MKPGMEKGMEESVSFRVTPDMFAQFEGKVIHEAYSTVSMVYHMEWASRKIILPFLEEHEEGIGGAVDVKHIAPAAAGSFITVKAVAAEIKENVILTETEAWSENRMIGKGRVKQVILEKTAIHRKLEEAGNRNEY